MTDNPRNEAATGMTCSWELRPSTPFRWIDDSGRPTPFLRTGADAKFPPRNTEGATDA